MARSSFLVDSHCHLPLLEDPAGIPAVLDRAREHGVGHMLCVAIDLDGVPDILKLARSYKGISASVGVHPNTAPAEEVGSRQLISLAGESEVIAIGETGLDYFRSRGDLAWQRQRFRQHIQIAREVNKPLIVHCREAKDDVLSLLREEHAEEVGGVMHCFVDDLDTAKRAIDLNFLISFSGILTFRNAVSLQQVATQLPESSLLVETDSPYLAPVPYRGKPNQPAYVRHVAECLAELRDVSLEQIAHATTANFCSLFKISVDKYSKSVGKAQAWISGP